MTATFRVMFKRRWNTTLCERVSIFFRCLKAGTNGLIIFGKGLSEDMSGGDECGLKGPKYYQKA